MAAVLCLDFDDTVIENNLMRAVVERFGGTAWRQFEARYKAGEITVEEQNAAFIDTIPASVEVEELRAYACEVARPRAGLMELIDWATWHGWLPVVVSNGYDFYVYSVLDGLGLDRVARHAGRTSRRYRWRVRYYSPRGIEVQEGFKVSYAAAFRAAGDFVVYCGDGQSDIEAARLAPVVFARSTLLERLDGEHPRVYPFETFHDVIEVLDREADAWLASFSSTTAAEG